MSTLPAHNCAVCGRFGWCEMAPVLPPSRRTREVLTLPICVECSDRLFTAEGEVADTLSIMDGVMAVWNRLEPGERVLLLRLFQIARRGE
jgi:hypothetical protein